jgi:hypothetical protein
MINPRVQGDVGRPTVPDDEASMVAEPVSMKSEAMA